MSFYFFVLYITLKFPFSCQNYFLLILLFNFSATEIFFFYLKEMLLGDRVCRVFMLNFFPYLKMNFCSALNEPRSVQHGYFLVGFSEGFWLPFGMCLAKLL